MPMMTRLLSVSLVAAVGCATTSRAATPDLLSPQWVARATPPPPPPVPEHPRRAEPPSDVDELFDCLTPDACPADAEVRARRRAGASWHCDDKLVTAHERPTLGLSVNGASTVMSSRGTAEVHVRAGVHGRAFNVSGCDHDGVIACIPAHRTVRTADATYDNTADTLCLWAE